MWVVIKKKNIGDVIVLKLSSMETNKRNTEKNKIDRPEHFEKLYLTNCLLAFYLFLSYST